MATAAKATVQVYRVYIKATPQAIWDALTKSEWTTRYGYAGELPPRAGRNPQCHQADADPRRAEGAPAGRDGRGRDSPQAGGGWSYILSDLKTLLETGTSLREGA